MITLDIAKSRKAPVPCTVMGRGKVAYPRMRRILVPLDFSGKARQALLYAIPMAYNFSAKIVLLHVIQPVYGISAATAGLMPNPRQQAQAALRQIKKMAATLVPKGLRGQNIVRIGSPYNEILAAARKLDVDMIVLTTHGRTGLKHFLLGSTAEQVMRHAMCAVLSVRRR